MLASPTRTATTIRDLLSAMADQRVSATVLCESYLKQIDEKTTQISALSHVLKDRAMAEAEAIDFKRKHNQQLGPLAGVPFVVKDLIDVEDAVSCGGLDILAGYKASTDAEVVRRLRAADAIVIGMARTDSGAFGVRTPEVVNPIDRSRIAGGSSGGSAAAVAAGWSSFAVGTDTGGSVRIPAACCGVYGFKPTKGFVPTSGVRPLAASFDHVGPIGRCADDLQLIINAMTNSRVDNPPVKHQRPFRVGYSETYRTDAAIEVTEAFTDFLASLERRGHSLEQIDLPSPEEAIRAHLAGSLSEAAAYYKKHFPDELTKRPSEAASGIEFAEGVRGYDFVQALDELHDMEHRIRQGFERVDFIVLPTLPCPPPTQGTTSVTWSGRQLSVLSALIRNTAIFNYTGFPALAMPLGQQLPGTAIPASVQIVGNHFRDHDVIAFAASLED